MREKRARRAAQTPDTASNGQGNDWSDSESQFNVEEQANKESTPERENSNNGSTELCPIPDVYRKTSGNDIQEESEVPWSV